MGWNQKQKRQRFFTMIFGAFIIFFTGYPHIWSVYQPYVITETGWSAGQASYCF
jgi:OFA family oxalate/formate antiporter-like MFS transporter